MAKDTRFNFFSRYKQYSTVATLEDGSGIGVNFSNGFFTTTNEKLAEGLRNNKWFKHDFKELPATVAPIDTNTTSKQVKGMVEVKNTGFNVDELDTMNHKDIVAILKTAFPSKDLNIPRSTVDARKYAKDLFNEVDTAVVENPDLDTVDVPQIAETEEE